MTRSMKRRRVSTSIGFQVRLYGWLLHTDEFSIHVGVLANKAEHSLSQKQVEKEDDLTVEDFDAILDTNDSY